MDECSIHVGVASPYLLLNFDVLQGVVSFDETMMGKEIYHYLIIIPNINTNSTIHSNPYLIHFSTHSSKYLIKPIV